MTQDEKMLTKAGVLNESRNDGFADSGEDDDVPMSVDDPRIEWPKGKVNP